MKEYHIFSTCDSLYFNFVFVLIKNLKKYKQENYKYVYHAFLTTYKSNNYQKKAKLYLSDDFQIKIHSANDYIDLIKSPNNKPWIQYLRCYICSLFPNLDQILYLDCDLFLVKNGLEELMDTDISNYYCACCNDIVPLYNNKSEVKNCKNENYFNSGVMLFNLKKIREDGIDKQLEGAVTGNWPYDEVKPSIYADQSLFNYLFRNNIKIVDPKFNNNLVSLMKNDLNAYEDYYIKKWNYTNLNDALADAIIVHYAGTKPWHELKFNTRKSNMVYPDFALSYYNRFFN